MNFYADSNYIHARVYALHGELLTFRNYYDMARNRNLNLLIPGLDAENIKNEYTAVKERLFENQAGIVMLLTEASASSREIFLLFLRCFEIQNLKLMCAAAFGLQPFPAVWYNIGGFASIGREMVPGAAGMDSVIENTAGTWMKYVFADKSVPGYGDAEQLIDNAIFGMVFDFWRSMRPGDRPGFLRLMSGFYSMLRITWSARLRNIYGIYPGDAGDYSGPGIADQGEKVKRYIREGDSRIARAFSLKPGAGGEELIRAERDMERFLYREVRRMFHDNFHSANTVVCYLVLLYRQIRNLFSIVDGLRFGLPVETIMENVICEE